MQNIFRSPSRRFAELGALFFLGLLLATGIAGSAAMKPASTWDLGGIKLGMTPDQVQKVFAARGFALTGPPGMMMCAVEQAKHELTNGATPFSCVQRMDATSSKGGYTVYYYEDFPHHPGVSRVYSVVYTPSSPSGNVSDADRQAFLAALTRKFGMYSARMGLGVSWCPVGAAYPMGPCAGVSIGVNMGNLMTTLADTDLDHRSEDAINAYVQSRRHNINPGI
jgi:hypothetical protein